MSNLSASISNDINAGLVISKILRVRYLASAYDFVRTFALRGKSLLMHAPFKSGSREKLHNAIKITFILQICLSYHTLNQGSATQNFQGAIVTSFKLKRRQWEPTTGNSINSIHYIYNSCFLANQFGMGSLCKAEICTINSNFCSSTFFHSGSVVKWGLAPRILFKSTYSKTLENAICKIRDLLDSQ